MSAIRKLQRDYRQARDHVYNCQTPKDQAAFVHGEAAELLIATKAFNKNATNLNRDEVLAELADVVISADRLAELMNTTIEECIALKTEADRGRG